MRHMAKLASSAVLLTVLMAPRCRVSLQTSAHHGSSLVATCSIWTFVPFQGVISFFHRLPGALPRAVLGQAFGLPFQCPRAVPRSYDDLSARHPMRPRSAWHPSLGQAIPFSGQSPAGELMGVGGSGAPWGGGQG